MATIYRCTLRKRCVCLGKGEEGGHPAHSLPIEIISLQQKLLPLPKSSQTAFSNELVMKVADDCLEGPQQ